VTATGDRAGSWVAPPRPEWVARINQEGSYMDNGAVLQWEAMFPAAAGARHLPHRPYVRSDEPFLPGTYEAFAQVENSAPMLEQVIDWIEDGTVPRDQVHNVHYADLVAAPLKVIDELYAHYGDGPQPVGSSPRTGPRSGTPFSRLLSRS
jgi:hypothetical protein